MEIRKIEVKEESVILIEEISKHHNLTPKLWTKNYVLNQNDVLDTVERLNKVDKNKLYLSVIEKNNSLVGFLWAEKSKDNSIMIISLFVKKENRKQGLATRLKEEFEKWCKEEQIKTIETTVSYINKKMISLNEKLGYKPGMVTMKKTL